MSEIRIEIEDDERIFYDTGKIWHKRLKRFVGNLNQDGYIDCTIDRKTQGIHRIIYEKFIGKIPEGYNVHHINWCRDDNRIENLDAITHEQNIANRQLYNTTSRVIGVCFHQKKGKWGAQNTSTLLNNGKQKHIGYFDTKELAGLARDAYVINNHLNFHTINYPSCRLEPPSA